MLSLGCGKWRLRRGYLQTREAHLWTWARWERQVIASFSITTWQNLNKLFLDAFSFSSSLNGPTCTTMDINADANPHVWRAVGGAGLQGGAGHTHPQPGEARGGAEGGLQEPDATPIQHPIHAELLHPPPNQGEGGEDGERWCERRQRLKVMKRLLMCSWMSYMPILQLKWSCWDIFLTGSGQMCYVKLYLKKKTGSTIFCSRNTIKPKCQNS